MNQRNHIEKVPRKFISQFFFLFPTIGKPSHFVLHFWPLVKADASSDRQRIWNSVQKRNKLSTWTKVTWLMATNWKFCVEWLRRQEKKWYEKRKEKKNERTVALIGIFLFLVSISNSIYSQFFSHQSNNPRIWIDGF